MATKQKCVRQLRCSEVSNALAGLYGKACTVQAVWLRSKTILEEALLRGLLEKLCQRFAILQLCLKRKGLNFVFKFMQEVEINFRICREDPLTVFHKVLNSSFDMYSGPLWKVRLVPLSPTLSVLLFAIHHSITDAYTNMTLCREYVNMINDFLMDRDLESTVCPVSPSVLDIIDVECPFSYLTKYVLKRTWRVSLKNFSYQTLFEGALPSPKSYKNAHTCVAFYEFSEIITAEVIKKCKLHNVTVNSFLVAVMDVAFLQTAKHYKYSKNSTNIYTSNSVNTRKYYPKEYQKALGCHYSAEEHYIKVALSDIKEFWTFAQKVHKKIISNLQDKNLPLKLAKIFAISGIPIVLNGMLKDTWINTRTDSHFVTSNMGDVTSLLETNSGPVEIVSLLRSAQNEFSQQNLLLAAQTFKGKLMVSLDYYSNKISRQATMQIFENFISNITLLSKDLPLKKAM